MYSDGPPTYGRAKARRPVQNIHTAAMWGIQDVALKTCLRRWTTGKSGERGSGISVQAARYDDKVFTMKIIYIYIKTGFWH